MSTTKTYNRKCFRKIKISLTAINSSFEVYISISNLTFSVHLQIPVNNSPQVKILDGFDDAGAVEPGSVLVEGTVVAQFRPQLTAQAGFK